MLLKKIELRACATIIFCVAATAVFAADYNITSGKTVITDAEIAGYAGKTLTFLQERNWNSQWHLRRSSGLARSLVPEL